MSVGSTSVAMNVVMSSAIRGTEFLQASLSGISHYSKAVEKINLLKSTNFGKIKRDLNGLQNQLGKIRATTAKISANPIRLNNKASIGSYAQDKEDMKSIARNAKKARDYNNQSTKKKSGLISTRLKTVGGVATVGALGAIKSLEPIKESLSFETSMADVHKATNANKKQLQALKTGIQKIIKVGLIGKEGSLLNVNEIASIQTAGGKSGVNQRALPKFTRDIVMASVAMDLTPAESATSFSKMTERMNIPIGGMNVLTNAFTRLESSGSNLARDLIDTTGRLSGVYKDLKFKPKNATAISNYMNTLEVSPELAASSFKILIDRFKKTDNQFHYYTKLKKGGVTSLQPIIKEISKTMTNQQIIKKFGSQGMNVINNMKGNYKTLEKSLAVLGTIEDKKSYESKYKEKLNPTNFMGSVKTEYSIKMATNQAKIIAEQNRKKLQSALMGDRLVPAYVKLLKVIPPIVEGMANIMASSISIYQANKPLINTLGAVALGITGIVLATKTVGVITGLFNPISLAIAGVAGASYLLYKNWQPIKGFFTRTWNGIKSSFSNGISFIKTAFSYTPIGIIKKSWKSIGGVFKTVTNLIKKPFATLFDWVSKKFKWLMNTISSVKSALTFGDSKQKELSIKQKARVIKLNKARDGVFINRKTLDPRPANNLLYKPTNPIHKNKPLVTLKESLLIGQYKKVSGGVSPHRLESPSLLTERAITNKTATQNSNHVVNNTNHMNISIMAKDGIIDADDFGKQLDKALRSRKSHNSDMALQDKF